MQPNQMAAMLGAAMYGGAGSSMPANAMGGSGNEMYNMVQSGSSGAVSRALMPMMGQANTGTSTAMERLYALKVSSEQWNQVQQMVTRDMSVRMSNMTNQALHSVGIKPPASFLGMGRGGIGAWQAMMPSLLASDRFQNVMGGDIMGAYQNAFANRFAFGPRMANDWTNPGLQATQLSNAVGFQNELMHAGRGPSGLVNHAFTQGFRDEEQSSLGTLLARSGRRTFAFMGDEAGRALAVQDTGMGNRMMRTLSQLTGQTSMSELVGTMNQLTQGQWVKQDFGNLNHHLIQMQSAAALLNIPKPVFANTVSSMVQSLQGAAGFSAGDIMMGMNGGAMTGLGAATRLATHAYQVAQANGAMDPFNLNRVMLQQTGLYAMGMSSPAGRTAAILEFSRQQGNISDRSYREAQGLLRTGSGEDRARAAAIVSQAIGAPTYQQLSSDSGIRAVYQNMQEPAAAAAAATIHQGVRTEFKERTERRAFGALGAQVDSLRHRYGLVQVGDPAAIASGQVAAAISAIRGSKRPGADSAASELEDSVRGLSGVAALQAVRSRLSEKDMAEYRSTGTRAIDAAGTDARVVALNTILPDAARAGAVMEALNSQRNKAGVSDEKKIELADRRGQIDKLLQANKPGEANALAMDSITMLPAKSQAFLRERLGRVDEEAARNKGALMDSAKATSVARGVGHEIPSSQTALASIASTLWAPGGANVAVRESALAQGGRGIFNDAMARCTADMMQTFDPSIAASASSTGGGDAGKGKGGKGELRITGKLTLIDPRTGRETMVNVSANGE